MSKSRSRPNVDPCDCGRFVSHALQINGCCPYCGTRLRGDLDE